MSVPIAIVTDLDNRPDENGIFTPLENEADKVKKKQQNLEALKTELIHTDITLLIAKEWTLEWCLYKSCLASIFKDALAKVHSGTDEFKKNEEGNYKDTFQGKFIKKLSKKEGTSPIDKVAVANEFADLLEKDVTITKEQLENDDYLSYLINSIKHIC